MEEVVHHGGNSSESGEKSSSEENQESKKKFGMKQNGVLTNSDEINWNSLKSEIENLYLSLPTITMELYQLNVNQEDVLGFNTEYDKLTAMVKVEKKEETLLQLTKLYDYLPKFLRGTGQDELYITLVETKNNVLKAYSKLDSQNWQEISNDVKNGIDSYSRLLTSTEVDSSKQYNVSKTYIMLNELQKAVTIQDSSVFLIKYKNLIEEINNI
ncbi:MAG: hypothetical protein HFJ36_00675 [Clostridia bacterium]|nr:hypothetical protein [Clostridia bacterium]